MSGSASEEEETIARHTGQGLKRRRISSDGEGSNVASPASLQSENEMNESITSLEDLKKRLSQRVITNGSFFTVNYDKSAADGSKLISACNFCSKEYKATFKSTSNYVSHLKVRFMSIIFYIYAIFYCFHE